MSENTKQADAYGLSCLCPSSIKTIFSCPSASNLGCLAGQAARQLTELGLGSLYGRARIAARVSGITTSTEAALTNLVIDGRGLSDATNPLRHKGLSYYAALAANRLGKERSRSLHTHNSICRVIQAAKGLSD